MKRHRPQTAALLRDTADVTPVCGTNSPARSPLPVFRHPLVRHKKEEHPHWRQLCLAQLASSIGVVVDSLPQEDIEELPLARRHAIDQEGLNDPGVAGLEL